jgi:DNA replication protein DnaC
MRRALQQFEADKAERDSRLQERRESIFRRQPRLKEIETELKGTMSRIIAGALRRGTDPRPAVERLRDENLSLQEEKRRLLADMSLPMDALEERPGCVLCDDTDYRGGAVCRCLKNYYAREQQKELSRMLDLGNQSFDTFELDWYPEGLMPGKAYSYRHHMEVKVLDYCKEFAMGFGKRPGNLLLFGAPGLGKTHLSAAIAREVSAEGWSVVYDTAAHVFERFENQKFSREEDAEVSSDVERILNCDLLILDDLGTEMTTAFVQSALYQIINTRLMEKKSTIINSNLSPDKIAQRYSAQIASRIEGEYHILGFVGEDIRKLKKQRM